MLTTNNDGRIYTYVVELDVTVGATGVTADGAPVLTKIDDSEPCVRATNTTSSSRPPSSAAA